MKRRYGVQQGNTSIRIPLSKHKDALEAISNLHGQETISDSLGTHFAFVPSSCTRSTNLIEALKQWRWEPRMDKDYNIIDLTFKGEFLGDEDVLFGALAPFIDPESNIHMKGEDGKEWSYLFNDETYEQVIH